MAEMIRAKAEIRDSVKHLRSIPSGSYVKVRSRRSVAKSLLASAICILPGFYCIGVSTFALRNWGDYATAVPQFTRYIVIPSVLAAMFLYVALFGSRMARINIGGVACGVLVLLFLFEARLERQYVTAVEGLLLHMSPTSAGKSPGLPAGRTVKGLNRAIGTQHVKDALLGGLPFSTVSLCENGSRMVSYTADRFGFRNPDKLHDAAVDVALVGDSFVEGICLPDGQDFVGQVRKRHPGTVSFGTRGAGPLLDLAVVGRYGPIVRPAWTVIVFYEGNDWQDLEGELRTPWLRDVLDSRVDFGPESVSGATLRRARAQVDHWQRLGAPKQMNVFQKTHVFRNFLALHQTWTRLGLGYPKVGREKPEFPAAIARAKAIAGGWGGRLAIVYVPQTGRFEGLITNAFIFDQIRDQVTAAAADNGVPMVDLTPTFGADPDFRGLYAQGHLSARGARVAAARLARFLAGTMSPESAS
jgi:hypothetical protein